MKDFHLRWPHFGDHGKDDSGNNASPSTSADGGTMLDYPPGVGHCGGKYPIWRKEKNDRKSTVCVQTETSNCTYTFEIDTYTCPGDGREWYILQTNVTNSVFCFAPNYCLSSPCANGGKCVAGRDGFTCKCTAGHTGPTCDGDPCSVSRTLPYMEVRGPSNHVFSRYTQDRNIQPGWYDSSNATSILTRPVSGIVCGNIVPMWVKEIIGDLAMVCLSANSLVCYHAFLNTRTQTCNDGRRVFRLLPPKGPYNYCYDVDACVYQPCMHNGTCVPNNNKHTCTCQEGYSGSECEIECIPIVQDLLIIEDVSTSVGPRIYEKMKTFVLDTIRNISISATGTNVAFMAFSERPEVVFHLNTYRDSKTRIMKVINSHTHTGGDTFLGDAIRLATSEVFTETNGDRFDVPNVVLLFTDGYSDANEDVRSSIGGLKAKAEVFVVTVTDQEDNATVDLVASSPAVNHVFHIDASETVSSIKDVTSSQICTDYRGR
ncbi:matrilin-2-like [Haliotis asinina]|uniref:matrilin-2-like n=1 Tax=Haliotis asinina TaxID=109174 RepID=UPI0035327FE1